MRFDLLSSKSLLASPNNFTHSVWPALRFPKAAPAIAPVFGKPPFEIGIENQEISPTLPCPNCNRSFVPAQSFPRVELATPRSNSLPSLTKKNYTRHILEQEKNQLKLYDEELDIGIARILKEKKNSLARQIEERENWMAGIRRLPVEVLEEIFLFVCSSKDWKTLFIHQAVETVIIAPALTLSKVSHHWRNVAFRCPHLWTSIDVDVAQTPAWFEEILRTYLGNSANLPLDIAIKASGDWSGEDDYRKSYLGDNGVAILDAILSQSFRFETLKFSHFDLDHGLFDTPKYTFPLLRRFETDNELEESNSWLAESLQQAPLLDTVSAVFTHHVFPLPYCQLTSLKMRKVRRFQYFDNTLQKCSSLRRLDIDGYYNYFTTQDNNPQPLELPSLQYFSFATDFAPSALQSQLPNSISLPQLNQLSVTYTASTRAHLYADREWPCPAFASVLQSCSSTLRKLSLSFRNYSLTASSAHRTFELLHGLTHLDISIDADLAVSGFLESLLSTLTISEGLERASSIAVPNLTSLRVTITYGAHLLTERISTAIVTMISSRACRKDVAERRESHVSPVRSAFFDLRQPAASISSLDEKYQNFVDSRKFIKRINAAQLDPGTKLRVLAGPRSS
ncbi:hypothetical protein L218DRAFT_1079864 [Marasmius fiardii PR-910]|nr:hypothetical protein L218DRAFT_1079864 [Marasmius fiardii PR-910]